MPFSEGNQPHILCTSVIQTYGDHYVVNYFRRSHWQRVETYRNDLEGEVRFINHEAGNQLVDCVLHGTSFWLTCKTVMWLQLKLYELLVWTARLTFYYVDNAVTTRMSQFHQRSVVAACGLWRCDHRCVICDNDERVQCCDLPFVILHVDSDFKVYK